MLFINAYLIEFNPAEIKVVNPITVIGFIDWEVDFDLFFPPKQVGEMQTIQINLKLFSHQTVPAITIQTESKFNVITARENMDAKNEDDFGEYAALVDIAIKKTNDEILDYHEVLRQYKVILSIDSIVNKLMLGTQLFGN